MSEINLQLEIYVEEVKQEGFTALKNLLARTDHLDISVLTEGQRRRSTDKAVVTGVSKFNVVEGILVLTDILNARSQVVEVRYRPSVSSELWAKLTVPTVEEIPSIASEEEHEDFQFFLSLVSFQNSSHARNVTNIAILEALCRSNSLEDTMEKTIFRVIVKLFPEVLETHAWGYADAVPFRDLSLEEEWEVARTGVLESSLEATTLMQHQYVFSTLGAKPKVPIPVTAVREHQLMVYKL